MKGFLRFLAVLFLLAVIGAGIFLATFDADRYRPLVIKKMEEGLGHSVRLERIALSSAGGFSVELQGLELPPELRINRMRIPLMPLLSHQLVVTAGTAVYNGMPLEEIRLRAVMDPTGEQVDLKEASAKVSAGSVHLSGQVRRLKAKPEGDFRLKMENIRLSNVNLLREVFDRLTVIPGLTDNLLSKLPPSYSRKLTEKDTLLQPVNSSFTLQNGAVSFQEFRAATDSFELIGSGQVGLDGGLNLSAQIFVQQELSAAFIKSAEELRFLADDSQRILLPVRLGGTVQRPAVSPDLQAITAKLFSNKAEDLVGDLLNKVLEKKKKKEQLSGG